VGSLSHFVYPRAAARWSLSLLLLVSFYLLQERLRPAEDIGVCCDETLTVLRFESVGNGDEATKDGSTAVP
jgi:hypothetical protein